MSPTFLQSHLPPMHPSILNISTVSLPYPWVPHPWIQPTADKDIRGKKFPES